MNQRFLARVILEAVTPLQIGTGEKDTITDQMVALDVNQLPYIPGTAIAGVLRNIVTLEIGEKDGNQIFGFQGAKEDDSFGSRLIISSGQMIGKDGKVIEGLKKIDFSDNFYKK
ncbi:MAG: RAMP superfamily CRISPR-associated protein, partial [Lentimicrobiaceae bacterium]|nr:RAMP superfamily CRISPR-associated protein [Lentimicrobiaceae bacterium]